MGALTVGLFASPAPASPNAAAHSWGYPFTVEAQLASAPASIIPPVLQDAPLPSRAAVPVRLLGATVSATPQEARAIRTLADTVRKPRKDVSALCETVDCLADLIAGPNRGAKMLRLIADYGYNPIKGTPEGPAFSPEQLDALLDTFAGLPAPFLEALGDRHRTVAVEDDLSRFADTVHHLGPVTALVAISGPGSIGIRLGPIWRASSPQAQRLAVLHELAHDYSRRIGTRCRWRIKWAEAVFRDDMRALSLRLPAGRISRYAATNPDEDFAESVVAYRYAPATLAAVAPNRFVFIRDEVFRPQAS